MKLTIQNHKRLEGKSYNTRWRFTTINEQSDRYIFHLESIDGNQVNIEVVRERCENGEKFMARYQNEWFFLTKYDFETPEKLINAFRNF